MGNVRLLLVSGLEICILYVQSSQLLDEAVQNLANTKSLTERCNVGTAVNKKAKPWQCYAMDHGDMEVGIMLLI